MSYFDANTRAALGLLFATAVCAACDDAAAPAPAPSPPASPAASSSVGSAATPASAPVSDAAPGTAKKAPAAVVRLDSRTLRLDGRFDVHGSGSKEDPYRIGWSLLTSGAEGFDPRFPEQTLPARIDLLAGNWIQIDGFLAAPLVAESTSELLVMLDRWDGCCIGLPPTPFDSIEASLPTPIAWRGQHLIRFGTVRGRLEVDPFVAGGLLMGLYRLEETSVEGHQ